MVALDMEAQSMVIEFVAISMATSSNGYVGGVAVRLGFLCLHADCPQPRQTGLGRVCWDARALTLELHSSSNILIIFATSCSQLVSMRNVKATKEKYENLSSLKGRL
ncbi:uncharacterized protein J3R85_009950 [Psidium guajava]|nr:uncharacterized protein J3R85_009950 [Psidium guajava]